MLPSVFLQVLYQMEIGRLIFYGTMGKLIYIHPKCENNCDKTCFTYITVSYFISELMILDGLIVHHPKQSVLYKE